MKLNSKIRQILSFVLFIREGLISDKIGLITYCKQMLSLFLTCTQFLNAKIFYMGNRGYYNYIFLKGEIMGLDGLQFDAVKKFNASMEQSNEEMRQQMEAKNITVPIVAQQPKDLEKGVKLQADPENKEEKKTTAPIKAVNDGQGAVSTVETDDADPNVKAQQEEAKKDAKPVADKNKTAFDEIADNRQAKQAEAEKTEAAYEKPAGYPQVERIKTDTRDILPPKLTGDKKDEIKAAAKEGYITNFGMTEKEAKANAEIWADNEEHRVKFERRQVFLTKDEESAFKKTNTQGYETGYIHNEEARDYLRNKGYTTSDQIKEFALKGANLSKIAGEETYYASQADITAMSQLYGISEDAARDICHHSGIDFFNAPRRKVIGALAGGTTAAGTALLGNFAVNKIFHKNVNIPGGKEVSSGSHSSSNSAAGAITDGSGAGATGNAEAGAGAIVKRGGTSISISGDQVAEMVVGVASGALGKYVYDRITTPTDEKVVINPFVKKPVEQGKVHKLNLHLDVPELSWDQPVKLPEKEEDCENTFFYEPTCTHTVERGQSWWTIAEGTVLFNNKPIRGNEVRAYKLAQQLRYGMTDAQIRRGDFFKVGTEYVQYSDFTDQLTEENLKKYPILKLLVGKQITFNCDGKIAKSRVVRGHSQVTNNSSQTIQYQRDCKTQQVSRVR